MTTEQFDAAVGAVTSSTGILKANMLLSCGRVISAMNGQKFRRDGDLVWVGSAETGDLSIIDIASIQALTTTRADSTEARPIQ